MAPSDAMPPIEVYWSLADKADKMFAAVRDLPPYVQPSLGLGFSKVFLAYTRLWKYQQENRQRLVDAGLKRWEVGEIASRIGQLYYGHYLRTCEAAFLSEAYVFYEAVLSREYFREGMLQDLNLAYKQLRFLARFVVVCLLLGKRETVHLLVNQLRITRDECKAAFPETNFKDWKKLVQDILKFLKADTAFMNRRPLRYIVNLDPDPDSVKKFTYSKRLNLREAILCSYHQNEIKFAELTLDTFRMHQCLEWEPSGSFYQTRNNGSTVEMPSRIPQLPTMTDPALPPNPRKAILYRPAVTHFLAVLASLCEELASDGILLIYLSASGKSGASTNDSIVDNLVDDFPSVNIESERPSLSPNSIYDAPNTRSGENDHSCVWLCSHGSDGVNCLYPCDLIPFTRRPLFLIIDSESSKSFMAFNTSVKAEKMAMFLSPSSPSPTYNSALGLVHPNGSQFTMFLTAPLQAFCLLLGFSGSEFEAVTISVSFPFPCVCYIRMINITFAILLLTFFVNYFLNFFFFYLFKYVYNKAEQTLSLTFNEWTSLLVTSDSLDLVWARIIHDPLLRRLLLRFIFCKSVLELYAPTSKKEFIPECVPCLPESVLPSSPTSQSAIFEIAKIFGRAHCFNFSDKELQSSSKGDEDFGTI